MVTQRVLQYLSNPDAGNIRAELIRYVVLLPFPEPVPQCTQELRAGFIASMLSQTNVRFIRSFVLLQLKYTSQAYF